ncbi:MAG: molybdopterin biosynthesis protein [Oscillospiraceae bacterium]|nr:molybdopterin biosynthesis protein [Oscillospiraceae bacterium]
MAKRNLYLSNTPVHEALDKYLTALKPIVKPQVETIPVTESLGRITETAVFAKYCSPLYNAAAMDGVAVNSDVTIGATEANPITLRQGVDFVVVDTGDPIKNPCDAVIMAEDLTELENGDLQIIEPAAPWQHVRPIGEDIVAGEMIIPSRHKIRPIDIGVLLAGGITKISVIKQPTVAIFPTGTEIIEPDQEPQEGDIIESNSRMFEAMAKQNGANPTRFAPIADDYNKLKNAIDKAIDEHDMVIVNAGSSAGTEDFTVHILRELGEVLVHGVAIKPGKPVILAIVKGKPVIGLPGYPVSAYINFENFVIPVLNLMNGEMQTKSNMVKAVVSKRLVSSLKHKEYVRVKVGKVEDKLVASPLARGAGAAMSLVRADGFCVIEQNSEGVEAGETVNVELYRDLSEIDNTVVAIGSHDLILDVIADLMPTEFPGNFLSSTHLGSMGGLMALKRGEAHIAPTHLLNEDDGVYNVAYLKKMFNQPMALIKGVNRIQGIIVERGNPLGIKDVKDLVNVKYINRQRGAGTRVLLDYLLKKENIDPQSIKGYDREGATHMAVAAAIAGKSADAGMGILSAAKAMNLDFVPVGNEEYDFAIPVKYLDLPHVQKFITVLKSDEFKAKLEALGGYSADNIGKIVYVDEE